MKASRISSSSGFNLAELIIVVLILAVLAGMLVPGLAMRNRRTRCGMSCINNLKQIGLACRTWQLDNNDQTPMQTAATNGGTLEFVASGQAWVHFLVMSNELSTPRILVCPDERPGARVMADTFSSRPATVSKQVVFKSDRNVSYFVGVDAEDKNPLSVISGDRGLMINSTIAKPGLLVISTNDTVAWFQPRHQNGGNIGLADGSVQTVSSPGLTSAFRASGLATNRLAMP